MRYALIRVFLIAAVLFLPAGCSPRSAAPAAPPTEPATESAAAEKVSPSEPVSKATAEPAAGTPAGAALWQADGVISAGEYAHSASAGRMTVHWINDGSFLYIALQARTSGWLSIGFDPDRTHRGADIIIGAVSNGQAVLLDSYGTSERGTYHTADTELGGEDNIAAFGGTSSGGVTTIEFQLPLDSGDGYDKVLQPGTTVPVILAYGVSSDLTSMHSFATFGELALDVPG